VRNDNQSVIDLSTAIKDFAVKTKETFQEVSDKLEWNNKLRAFLALIRQHEFALPRLESNLDQTLVALQFVLTQRFPANLLPPPPPHNQLHLSKLGGSKPVVAAETFTNLPHSRVRKNPNPLH
jgi:hypothetical protein